VAMFKLIFVRALMGVVYDHLLFFQCNYMC